MTEPELRTVISTVPFALATISIVDVGGEYFTALSSSCRKRERQQVAVGVDRQVGRHVPDDVVAVQTPCSNLRQDGRDRRPTSRADPVNDEVAGVDSEHLDRVGHETLQRSSSSSTIATSSRSREPTAVLAADRPPRPSSTSAAS